MFLLLFHKINNLHFLLLILTLTDFGDEQMGLHGLHLFHSPQSTGEVTVVPSLLSLLHTFQTVSYSTSQQHRALVNCVFSPSICLSFVFLVDLYKQTLSFRPVSPPTDNISSMSKLPQILHSQNQFICCSTVARICFFHACLKTVTWGFHGYRSYLDGGTLYLDHAFPR